jgi:PAS domain S-box-containing protein
VQGPGGDSRVFVFDIPLRHHFSLQVQDFQELMRMGGVMCPKPSYEVLEQRVRELEQQSAELKHSREALQKCEMRFRDLVENAKDAIFVIQDGMIKIANSSAIAMTGYTAEELTRIPFANIIHPEERENFTAKHLRRVKGEAVVDNYTFRVLTKTGAGAWQQINSFSITWDSRPAALSFIRDLTQAKQLEKRFIESQKLGAISTLAGEIAHDFNNLMTTIQGNVSLMLFDIPASHPNYQNLINIDLVIPDMVMPEMNGGEVFDRIKRIKGDANFLLASGYSADGQASEILNRGCNGFIQKPFTLKQLARKIRETLAPAENRAKK